MLGLIARLARWWKSLWDISAQVEAEHEQSRRDREIARIQNDLDYWKYP